MDTQLLATIFQIRSNPSYQRAETMRRQKNSVSKMARADRNSVEFGAVSLLINSWETISVLVLQIKDKDLIFEITPVLYMFTELSDAIEIISCEFPDYAANFRLLSKLQAEWLKFKDDRYQTGADGRHARAVRLVLCQPWIRASRPGCFVPILILPTSMAVRCMRRISKSVGALLLSRTVCHLFRNGRFRPDFVFNSPGKRDRPTL